MSNNFKIATQYNSNGNVLIEFIPSESTWKFPKNNKLKLFNELHYIITLGAKPESDDGEFFPTKSLSLADVELKTKNLLVDWIERGELIIK